MREISFRGKRLNNGKWVYGFYAGPVSPLDSHEIFDIDNCMGASCEVDPETVGQYIGLFDKNGVKIWEHDIISAKGEDGIEYFRFVVRFGKCGGVENAEHDVGYQGFFFDEITDGPSLVRKDPIYFLNAYDCYVIGNIHDNQNFLGGYTHD